MIFIVVKFTVRPEHSEGWLDLVADFTRATREEPGNLFFEWSKSVEVPNQYVLVEGFASEEAGVEHVNSEHFKKAMATMPQALASTPEIINVQAPVDGWGPMGELKPA
ncbi:putative quinol monooxygenase [Kutzneria viridogrisea]|uniref:Quinol monooxygenase YgiN n=1 Tax=Kutzneria viridogrisea TaxID=47990 RepID=A0ABR6BKE2_9PSEU|nr:quinol monooxygenase YgiN [Kutzneria viridogrisea]